MAPEILHFATADGLTIEAARFNGGSKTPALCVPGLTRNRRDFDRFAAWFSKSGRDVYAVSLRGRGASDYDPNYLNYHPVTYRDDLLGVVDQLGLEPALFVGTSLGGIIAMLINEVAPERVAAVVINDIGPTLAAEGIARIASYVGAALSAAANLDEAAAQIRAVNEVAFPGRDDGFWRDFARNTFRETPDGSWVLDYDPAIGKALAETGPAPDLWPAFASLRDKPALLLRGAISDLLSPQIVDEMRAVHPRLAVCEVPGVGHAPTLTEPEAAAAIDAFVDGLD